MKYLIKFIFLSTSILIASCSTIKNTTLCFWDKGIAKEFRCDKNRCYNRITQPCTGLSFTPQFKNLNPIELYDEKFSCDADTNTTTPIRLPKNSSFRQTLDQDAQTSKEMIIHVYDVDKINDSNSTRSERKTYDKFFSKPLKLCLDGKNQTSKSYYNRTGGVNTGVLVVPFKLRSGDILSDSTIGPYISYKWEIVEILLSGGLSQIAVSHIDSDEVESKTGLTWAAGINFEIQKNWDVAILTGTDHISGDIGDDWEYQDDFWFSFGIGFNFTR